MTDAATLSRDLALALGWKISHVTAGGEVHVCIRRGISRKFDHTDPTIVLPLIEWLMREHYATLEVCRIDNRRYGVFISGDGWHWADTLPEAVTRAVIAVRGKA